MDAILSNLFQRYPALRVSESELTAALQILITAFENGNKLLVCGNGGSAADSEHMVGELMKGFLKARPIPRAHTEQLTAAADEAGRALAAGLQGALPAISLVSQSSLNTAVANDIGAEMVFAQQVYGLGRPGDLLLGISTSGNSTNVINALLVARAFGLRTIVLTGRSGGKLAKLADVAVRVPADSVAEIQEMHLPVYHWLCMELEERFYGDAV